jgi:hypothetical protein
MKQYSHFLFVKQVTESTQDESGNWSTASESWVLHSVCREQSNGKGSVINSQDGKAIVFASVIHLPLTASRLKENTEVLVSETSSSDGLVRIKGQVLKYDVGQLHHRLWV